MGDESRPVGARSALRTTAMLAGLIAVAGILGLVITLLQRPPVPPRPAPVVLAPAPLPIPVAAAAGPVSAFGFSAADDPATHRVVLFGGVDSYDQTWLWDGSRWSRAHAAVSPPGRFHAATAYDPHTRLLMLFGGRLEAGRIVNDTWAWNGTTWRELDAGVGGPPPGDSSLMAWDGAKQEMVLVVPATAAGGETWIWTGAHWSRLRKANLPASPVAGQMAFDPVSGALLFVSPLLPPLGPGVTTWAWNGASWNRLDGNPPSATAGLALDPTSGHLLLCSDPTPSTASQLWSWAGTSWQLLPESSIRIQLGIEVTDADRGAFLMLGFTSPPSQEAPQPMRVWGWTPAGWHLLDTA